MPGTKVFPGAPQTRLSGRYLTVGASRKGVTFTRAGRFSKDRPVTGEDEDATENADMELTQTDGKSQKNSLADRAGTYSINGYVMTLRYDNGKVERVPFFFTSKEHTELWFEDSQAYLDTKK